MGLYDDLFILRNICEYDHLFILRLDTRLPTSVGLAQARPNYFYAVNEIPGSLSRKDFLE